MIYAVEGLLLASAVGYWVLERADKQKGTLKRVGQVLGWLLILASLIGAICRVSCGPMGKAGYRGKGWCPLPPKVSPLPPPPQ